MEVKFHRFLIALFSLVQDISDFMCPAALQHYLWVDQRQGSEKSIATVYNYQFHTLAGQAATVQIAKKGFPGNGAFSWG